MSFLEWRRFNFFDIKKNIDLENITRALGNTNVTATSCGHGTLVICDSEGIIHLVYRGFHVTTFRGYLRSASLAMQFKSLPILITIGEDEVGDDPLIKIWDLEEQDRQGNPVCLKMLRTSVNERSIASILCVSDACNMMAVGFANGVIILYRGNLIRDRVLKQKILRDKSDPVTGLAFKTTGKYYHLFVATTDSILQYNVTVKDKEEKVILDNHGCAAGCSVIADSIQDCPFVVARKEAIYCYIVDGRGPCYAVDGPKVCIQWFRTYLIIVAEDKDTLSSPVTVSSTNNEETWQSRNDSHVITVLDIQNKFIVHSSVFPEIQAVLPEWGSFYILTKDRHLHHFLEKDLQSKLELLFKKNLYEVCIRIAKNQQYDSDGLIDIFRLYGDHLYARSDHNGAIEQYIKTIGKLEPSYVIRKFLDSQHIDNLIKYLSALHKQGVATGDHTILLLNCYTKRNNFQKLKEFILAEDTGLDFDLDVAISMIRKSSSEDARLLAKKNKLHLWYVKITLEDHQKYMEALQYMVKLRFEDAYDLVIKFGNTFIENIADEFTEFLKKLCTSYCPSDEFDQQSTYQADPEDFIYLFLNNSMKMVEFLEYLTKFSSKWNHSIYDTLIEHYLYLWFKANETTVRIQYEQKIITTLQSVEINYDKNQALVLCSTHNFTAGILYLLEENKLYHQMLRYQLNNGNYQNVLGCCRKYGYQEPSLWIKALWSASTDILLPPNILCEILDVIEKGNLLSPLQVVDIVSRSKTLIIHDIRSYLLRVLKADTKIINEESALIEKYKKETESIREHIEKIQNKLVLFQGSICNICRSQLERPSVHFLCQHAFHQHCYQGHADNENECPYCVQNNQKILGLIKSQEQNRDLHETFHSQLERADDNFSLIADYFGRNVFNQIEVNTEFSKQIQPRPKLDRNIKKKDVDRYDKREYEIEKKPQKPDNEEFKATSFERHIPVLWDSPNNVVIDESLTSAIVNKLTVSTISTNPFDEYDESKNPFHASGEDEIDDDYDKNLNPFA